MKTKKKEKNSGSGWGVRVDVYEELKGGISIKGRNSVANLRKNNDLHTNVDLVNDDVYTKFGLILSICSQDIM